MGLQRRGRGLRQRRLLLQATNFSAYEVIVQPDFARGAHVAHMLRPTFASVVELLNFEDEDY
jgi:hypothetical protein